MCFLLQAVSMTVSLCGRLLFCQYKVVCSFYCIMIFKYFDNIEGNLEEKGPTRPYYYNTTLWFSYVLSQSLFTMHITCKCSALFIAQYYVSHIFHYATWSAFLVIFNDAILDLEVWKCSIFYSNTWNVTISPSVPRYRSWSPASGGSESWYSRSNEKND